MLMILVIWNCWRVYYCKYWTQKLFWCIFIIVINFIGSFCLSCKVLHDPHKRGDTSPSRTHTVALWPRGTQPSPNIYVSHMPLALVPECLSQPAIASVSIECATRPELYSASSLRAQSPSACACLPQPGSCSSSSFRYASKEVYTLQVVHPH